MSLNISFRPDEEWLYNEICKHSSKGGWIKDVLKQHLANESSKKEKQEESSPPKLAIDSILGI